MILRRRNGGEHQVNGREPEAASGEVARLNPFKGFKKEVEIKVVEPKIATTAVTKMVDAWKRVKVSKEVFDIKNSCSELTRCIEQEIRGIEYCAEDITEFSKRLETLQQTEENFPLKSGLFLSALINNSNGRDFTVFTSQLKRKPTCFGYMNAKNVVVEGSLNWGAAYRMKSGRLEVNGGIGKAGGRNMEGGELIVHGNAQKELGKQMTDGKIITHGTVVSVGGHRKGGEIYLEGEGEPYIERSHGGAIYKNGVLWADR